MIYLVQYVTCFFILNRQQEIPNLNLGRKTRFCCGPTTLIVRQEWVADSFVGCDSCPAGLLPQLVQQLQAATCKFHQSDPGLTGNGTFRLNK